MASDNEQSADTTAMQPSGPAATEKLGAAVPPPPFDPAVPPTPGAPPNPADELDAPNEPAPSVPEAAAAGRTTISDTAVAKVAGIAARKVNGVVALGSGSRALGALREAVGSSDPSQGVNVEVGETQVAVDVNLIAAYGSPLQDVANGVRAAVYAAVERLVGLQVIEVNVEINDVHVPEVHDAKPAEDQ